jgi:hypothetical protein
MAGTWTGSRPSQHRLSRTQLSMPMAIGLRVEAA